MKNLLKSISVNGNPAKFVWQESTKNSETYLGSDIQKKIKNTFSLLKNEQFKMSEQYPGISIPKDIENNWIIQKRGQLFECFNTKIGIALTIHKDEFEIATRIIKPKGINIFNKKEVVMVRGQMRYSQKEKTNILNNLISSLKKQKLRKGTRQLLRKISKEERRSFFPSKLEEKYINNYKKLEEKMQKTIDLLRQEQPVPKRLSKDIVNSAKKMIKYLEIPPQNREIDQQYINNTEFLKGKIQLFLEYMKNPIKNKELLIYHYQTFFMKRGIGI